MMKKGVGWGEFGGEGRGKSSPVIKNQVFAEVAGMWAEAERSFSGIQEVSDTLEELKMLLSRLIYI